jgi:hypothetical protein
MSTNCGSGPGPAKGLAFLGRALVRIVATEGAVAHRKSAYLADNLVHRLKEDEAGFDLGLALVVDAALFRLDSVIGGDAG